MHVLGEATGVTSAHVFENVGSEINSTHSLRLAGWESGRSNSTVDDPRLAHLHPAPHFPRWAEVLGRGEIVSGHICDLPDEEREPLSLAGSLSVLAVPIFVNERWWGFIGFEDAENKRDWSSAETDALRAAAGIVAAAIKRDRAETRTASPGRRARSGLSRRRAAGRGTELARCGAPLPAGARRGLRRKPRLSVRERHPRRRPADRKPAIRVGRAGHHPGARQPRHAGHVLRGGRAGTPGRARSPERGVCGPGAGHARRRACALRAAGDPVADGRADLRRRRMVGAHRLRRLHHGTRVEPRRDRRSPDDLELDCRGDRAPARRGGPPRAGAEAARRLRHGARRDLHHRQRPSLRRRQSRGMRVLRRREARPDRPLGRRVPAPAQARDGGRGLGASSCRAGRSAPNGTR